MIIKIYKYKSLMTNADLLFFILITKKRKLYNKIFYLERVLQPARFLQHIKRFLFALGKIHLVLLNMKPDLSKVSQAPG